MVLNHRKVNFLLAVSLVFAVVNGWGLAWKLIVGLMAAFNLFLIGVELGRKM